LLRLQLIGRTSFEEHHQRPSQLRGSHRFVCYSSALLILAIRSSAKPLRAWCHLLHANVHSMLTEVRLLPDLLLRVLTSS